MKPKQETYFLVVVLVISAAVIGASLKFSDLESKLLPIIVAGITFILTLLVLVTGLRAKDEAKRKDDPGEEKERFFPLNHYRMTGIWVGGFAVTIFLVGFIFAVPVFIISYLRFSHTGWIKSICIAAVTTAFLYSLFELLLRVQLYRGFLPW